MKSISTVLSITLLFLFYSCKKEIPQPPIAKGEFYDCHKETLLDEIQTQNAIHGKWILEYIHCFGQEQGTYVEEGFEIEFKDDNSFILKQDGVITHSTTWELSPFNVDGFSELIIEETTTETQFIYGKFYICNAYLLFDGGSNDLCDTYYKKTN